MESDLMVPLLHIFFHNLQLWVKEPDNSGVLRPDTCFWGGQNEVHVYACRCGLVFEAF